MIAKYKAYKMEKQKTLICKRQKSGKLSSKCSVNKLCSMKMSCFHRWHPAVRFLPARSNRHLSPKHAGLHFKCKDSSTKLKLNGDKTEHLLIVSNGTSLPNPHPTSIHIGDTDILFPCRQQIWAEHSLTLSTEKHNTNISRSAYIEIWRIINICHYLTIDATKTLLYSFVLSKLDYCNSLLSGSLKHLLDKLQNSATRLIFKAHNTSNPSFRNFTNYQ